MNEKARKDAPEIVTPTPTGSGAGGALRGATRKVAIQKGARDLWVVEHKGKAKNFIHWRITQTHTYNLPTDDAIKSLEPYCANWSKRKAMKAKRGLETLWGERMLFRVVRYCRSDRP